MIRLIGIFISTLGFSSCLKSVSTELGSVQNRLQTTPELTIPTLMANKDDYEGKLVTIAAYYVTHHEGSFIRHINTKNDSNSIQVPNYEDHPVQLINGNKVTNTWGLNWNKGGEVLITGYFSLSEFTTHQGITLKNVAVIHPSRIEEVRPNHQKWKQIREQQETTSITEKEAIRFLTDRGHVVSIKRAQTSISIRSDNSDQKITLKDIEAINALKKVVELRVIDFEGIPPELFAKFRTFPHVETVVIHYQMPAESIQYLDKFPNVKTLKFWADQHISCEHLPLLKKLQVLHHESLEGYITPQSIKRIAQCSALKEIDISLPVPNKSIEILRNLPNLKYLIIVDKVILDKD